MHKIKNEQINKVILKYTEEKLNLRQIAKLYNVSHMTIKRLLIKNNIKIRLPTRRKIQDGLTRQQRYDKKLKLDTERYKKRKEYHYFYYINKRFGLSKKLYYEMLESQNHCCFICKKNDKEHYRRLSVDHNHKTGKVRNLLCDNCNILIGLAEESIEILKNSIKYLEIHK